MIKVDVKELPMSRVERDKHIHVYMGGWTDGAFGKISKESLEGSIHPADEYIYLRGWHAGRDARNKAFREEMESLK